ncbi:hypothetical protein B0H13DRAFT_193017 [Mycena leptocephala]|nr:hypothetical protein B0H13DRAFT_193017 [Mycena leptocephala]
MHDARMLAFDTCFECTTTDCRLRARALILSRVIAASVRVLHSGVSTWTRCASKHRAHCRCRFASAPFTQGRQVRRIRICPCASSFVSRRGAALHHVPLLDDSSSSAFLHTLLPSQYHPRTHTHIFFPVPELRIDADSSSAPPIIIAYASSWTMEASDISTFFSAGAGSDEVGASPSSLAFLLAVCTRPSSPRHRPSSLHSITQARLQKQ